MRQWITIEGVCDLLGFGRGTFYARELHKRADFPKPTWKDGKLRYRSSEVEAWKRKQERS